MTESGFLRISCNPLAVRYRVTLTAAIVLLKELIGMGSHRFWSLNQSIVDLPHMLAARVQGYRQIPDAVLLATAMQHNGQLVTLDSRLTDLVSAEERRFLHVIRV